MWLGEEREFNQKDSEFISEIAKRIFQLRLSYSKCQSVLFSKFWETRISESGSKKCVNTWVFCLLDRGKPEYRLVGGVCVNIK